ncbi:MAG: FAD-binding oxidoreductase [Actinomycetota bacterium]|nr:FAD-binding oxidoreductase [Actinomycetota bacterium]
MRTPEATRRVGVIGAGIVGLAAAFELERRGIEYDIFEYGAPGGGQSGGESRIFRHGHDDPRLIELAARSRQLWAGWEQEFGVQLISLDGVVSIGPKSLRRLELMRSVDSDIAVEEIGPERLKEALPALASYYGPSVMDENGGAIRTRLSIASLLERVSAFLIPVKVDAIEILGNGQAAVRASGIRRVYDAVLVCAGLGTDRLATLNEVAIPVQVEAQIRVTYPILPGQPGGMASIRDSSERYAPGPVYGSPVRGDEFYSVGLTEGIEVSANGLISWDRIQRLSGLTDDWVRKSMPGLDPERGEGLTCWLTRLPWAPDGLAIWQKGPTFHVVGNNLFKLAPVVAEKMVESALEGSVPELLRPEARLGSPVPVRKSQSESESGI